MKQKALLVMALMSFSSHISAETVPEATIFSYLVMEDFMQLKAEVLYKDEFETTAEFEARKAAHASRERNKRKVYVPINARYSADEERFSVPTCYDREIYTNLDRVEMSGTNAMNAEWSWTEISGERYSIKTAGCVSFDLPFELKKARELRDNIIFMGELEVEEQRPDSDRSYEVPKYGKRFVDNTVTYTYQAKMTALYVGKKDTGELIKYINFRPALDAEAKRLAEVEAAENRWSLTDFEPIETAKAVYPRRAQSRGITGQCEATFTVNEQGRVENVYVEGSGCFLFSKSIETALSKFRYTPRTIGGEPVEVRGVRRTFYFGVDEPQ